jgi:hypothetical protein
VFYDRSKYAINIEVYEVIALLRMIHLICASLTYVAPCPCYIHSTSLPGSMPDHREH